MCYFLHCTKIITDSCKLLGRFGGLWGVWFYCTEASLYLQHYPKFNILAIEHKIPSVLLSDSYSCDWRHPVMDRDTLKECSKLSPKLQ